MSYVQTIHYKRRFPLTSYALWAILIHFVVALLRCVYVFVGPLRLQCEEAQYWTWTRHLDWSYYSKPPLIAFCNYVTEWLFGHSEFSVRINAILCGMLIGWITYLFTYRLYLSARKAFWASMLVFVMPFYFEVSLFYSTDSILLLCWLWALYMFWQAFFTNRWRYWIAAGFAIGIGSLGKYAMLFLIPILFVYLLINDRRQLSNPRLYVSLLLGILLFSPVIIWNVEHQFIGYMHIQNLSGLGDTYHWKLTNINNFLFGQVALMSPFFVVMYWRMYKAYRRTQLMWYFLIPILFIWTIFFFISIIKKREANINWTMFVYVVLPVMLSSYIIDYHKEKRAVVLSVITLILFSVTMTIPYWESPLSKKILPVQKDPLRKIAVWKDMSDKVDSIYRCCDSRTTFIFTDDYILAAEMMYYLYPNEHIYFFNNGTRMCQFQLWKGVEQYANRSYGALFVQLSVVNARYPHVEATLAPNIAAAFDKQHTSVCRICYYRGDPVFQLDIYRLKDFRSLHEVPFTHY